MFSSRVCGVVGVLLFACSGTVSAQQEVTIQLPQFRFFTVNTTVSVPDSGRGHLGGVNRASSARSNHGAPWFGKPLGGSRLSRGTGTSSSSAGVTATVIDLHDMDDEILNKVAVGDPRADSVLRLIRSTDRKADFISRHVGTAADVVRRPVEEPIADARKLASLTEIRRENETAKWRREAEAVAYLEKAKSLEAEGKLGVAMVYYSMVTRQTDGDLRDEAVVRLESIRRGRSFVARER